MALTTQFQDTSRFYPQHRLKQPTFKKRKRLPCPWSHGRAYIPIAKILLLLLLSLGMLHLQWLGSKYFHLKEDS